MKRNVLPFKNVCKEIIIFRKSVWLENLDVIAKHNIEADMGHHSYRLGMNEYGDLVSLITNRYFTGMEMYISSYNLNSHFPACQTTEEATAMLNGVRRSDFVNGSTFLPPNNLKLPKTVDWRKEGYVTPIKNQVQFSYQLLILRVWRSGSKMGSQQPCLMLKATVLQIKL